MHLLHQYKYRIIDLINTKYRIRLAVVLHVHGSRVYLTHIKKRYSKTP